MTAAYVDTGQARAAIAGAAAALSLVALLAVLALSNRATWWPHGAAIFRSGPQQTYRINSQQCQCWGATHMLGGGCLAEVDAGTETLPCCGGEGYKCKPCPEAKQQALQCVSPRHMLLYAAPGCNIGDAQRQSSSSSSKGRCVQLTTADVVAGRWRNVSSLLGSRTSAALPSSSMPPPLLFQPGGQHGLRQAALTSNEALQRLWSAGFDRVVIAGDSTVRHFFNRLVSILRQQDVVIDGGGIAHAHYKLQAWTGGSSRPEAARADMANSGSRRRTASTAGGGTSSSTTTTTAFATDEMWVSPAANFIKGSWDEGLMLDGLKELTRRSFGGITRSGVDIGDRMPRGSSGEPGVGESGSNSGRSLTVDFVIGAKSAWQQPHVRQYFTSGDPAGATSNSSGGGSEADWRRRTLLVLSLCVWEQQVVFRSGWLEFVEEMRTQVGQLVLLTCPLDRLNRAAKAAGRDIVNERNQRLREMVAHMNSGISGTGGEESGLGRMNSSKSRRTMLGKGGNQGGSGGSSQGRNGTQAGRPLLLVDLDAMTQQLPPGSHLGVAPKDYHYQCMLSSSTTYNDTGPIQFSGGDGAPHPQYHVMRYDRLLVPPAGTCSDPVNFAGWEMLLYQLCPHT